MTLVEKYKILEQLGGNHKRKFSQVYLGEDIQNQQKVVIKALKKEASNEVLINRLREESRFSFNFDGLPKMLDSFESDTELILIKRFESGIPLQTYLNQFKGKKRLEQLILILSQLVPLVDHMHNQGVLHLDLKPGNILIDNTSVLRVSIIDFGMSLFNHEAESRSILFPLGYAAPELILNRLDLVDKRTDYFALAVTFWTCLQGKMPLIHPNPSITTNLQLTHPLPDLDPVFKKINEPIQRLGAKFSFRIPPNQLNRDEQTAALIQGMEMRYTNLSDFLDEVKQHQCKDAKKWWKPF